VEKTISRGIWDLTNDELAFFYPLPIGVIQSHSNWR
jgi:hypothetical protein